MVYPGSDVGWIHDSGPPKPRKGIHDVWLSAPEVKAQQRKRRQTLQRFRWAARLCRFKACDKGPLEKLKELFAESTTGIDRLVVIENRFRFWIFCIVYVAFFVLTLISVGKTLQNHFAHRDIVSISMTEGNSLLLPAVTFCNLNPLKRSAVCSANGVADLGHAIKRELCEKNDVMDIQEARNFTRGHLSPLMNRMLQENGTLSTLVHTKTDMVLNCSVKGESCLDDNLYRPEINPKFGMCYCIFCKGFNQSMISFQATSLPVDGLTLVLDTEKDEYLRSTLERGMIVMVHRRGVKPDLNEDGMYLPPYTTTYIGIETRIMERLRAPYKDRCVQEWPRKWSQYVSPDDTYFQQLCFSVCSQAAIKRQCQCYSEELPPLPDDTLPSCRQDARKKNCSQTILNNPAYRSLKMCDCPLKCQQEIYKTAISRAGWAESLVSRRNKGRLHSRVLVKVILYLESVIVERITQVPEVSDATTLSNVGGFMGMYLGLSFLVIFEILEIFVRWGIYLWKRNFRTAVEGLKTGYFRNLRLGTSPETVAKVHDRHYYGYFDSSYWKKAVKGGCGGFEPSWLHRRPPPSVNVAR